MLLQAFSCSVHANVTLPFFSALTFWSPSICSNSHSLVFYLCWHNPYFVPPPFIWRVSVSCPIHIIFLFFSAFDHIITMSLSTRPCSMILINAPQLSLPYPLPCVDPDFGALCCNFKDIWIPLLFMPIPCAFLKFVAFFGFPQFSAGIDCIGLCCRIGGGCVNFFGPLFCSFLDFSSFVVRSYYQIRCLASHLISQFDWFVPGSPFRFSYHIAIISVHLFLYVTPCKSTFDFFFPLFPIWLFFSASSSQSLSDFVFVAIVSHFPCFSVHPFPPDKYLLNQGVYVFQGNFSVFHQTKPKFPPGVPRCAPTFFPYPPSSSLISIPQICWFTFGTLSTSFELRPLSPPGCSHSPPLKESLTLPVLRFHFFFWRSNGIQSLIVKSSCAHFHV